MWARQFNYLKIFIGKKNVSGFCSSLLLWHVHIFSRWVKSMLNAMCETGLLALFPQHFSMILIYKHVI